MDFDFITHSNDLPGGEEFDAEDSLLSKLFEGVFDDDGFGDGEGVDFVVGDFPVRAVLEVVHEPDWTHQIIIQVGRFVHGPDREHVLGRCLDCVRVDAVWGVRQNQLVRVHIT